jgi:hypothetical protein
MLHKAYKKKDVNDIDIPDRVNVTLSESAKGMFEWLKNYDPDFQIETDAKIVSFLVDRGVEFLIQKGLQNAEPLDSEVLDAFSESAGRSLKDALKE